MCYYSLYRAYKALTKIANKITPIKYSVIDSKLSRILPSVWNSFWPANVAKEIRKLSPKMDGALWINVQRLLITLLFKAFIAVKKVVFKRTRITEVLITFNGLYP